MLLFTPSSRLGAPPPHHCCDFCQQEAILSRAATPSNEVVDLHADVTSSPEATPSNHRKRKMKGKKWRTGEHFQRVFNSVLEWRRTAWRREYRSSYLPPSIIMDDETAARVAKQIELRAQCNLSLEWNGRDIWVQELSEMLLILDEEHDAEQVAAKGSVKARKEAARQECCEALKNQTNCSIW